MTKIGSLRTRTFPALLVRGTIAWAALAILAPSGIAQLQFDELFKQHIPPNSDDTYAVVLGDVDGNGDLDLVLGNGGQQNRLYLNDGTGTFADATATRMPPDSDFSKAVALGDVDGDGDNDLVFGNSGQQNRLYLNDGTGRFTDATAARMPPDSDHTFAVALFKFYLGKIRYCKINRVPFNWFLHYSTQSVF